jgi:hypothetical protein
MSAFALVGCAATPDRRTTDIGPFLVPLTAEECAALGPECIRFRTSAWEESYLRQVIGLTPKDEDQ